MRMPSSIPYFFTAASSPYSLVTHQHPMDTLGHDNMYLDRFQSSLDFRGHVCLAETLQARERALISKTVVVCANAATSEAHGDITVMRLKPL